MAATWSITNLDRIASKNSKTDVVCAIFFVLSDSETQGSGDNEVTHTGESSGAVVLDTTDLSSFIDFEDITENDAISWAKSAISAEQLEAQESEISAQISNSNSTIEKQEGVPW